MNERPVGAGRRELVYALRHWRFHTTMLRHERDYDIALEHYSRPLMDGWLEYATDDEGTLTIINPAKIEGYYRYTDLTAQTEYLIRTVALSIREDFAEELRFLCGYDTEHIAVREIVNLPDRQLDLLLRLQHQNNARLAKAKRERFAEITNAELKWMKAGFAAAFGFNILDGDTAQIPNQN